MIDRSRFDAEDFLVDNTFQMYCAGSDRLCVDYWEKYILAHPEQGTVIAEARRLYLILSGHKRPINQELSSLQKKIKSQTLKVRLNRNFTWLKVAATIVVVLGAGILYYNYSAQKEHSTFTTDQTFQTKSGERKKITLPDGSIVLLNAKSMLTIGKEFNDKCRVVVLKGEGYFDVVHNKNKPFQVHTSDFNINVLGTAFNVKAYPDEVTSEATLIRGLITMEAVNGNGGIITLKPSQKVTFYKELESPKKEHVLKPLATHPEITINHYTLIKDSTIVETAWTQNRIEIYDQNFDEIKDILEKWFNVQISFTDPEIEKYRFTATITHENIEQVLAALKKAENNFKYEIKGNQVIISK